ncbi:Myb-like DNA-binding protein [Nitzschia inconspicua]|uniref:Myb-like DNA-binding protein n=1 Tax=Nitzschia inconspicua TaxID=303405 RepID=A0A9K3L3V2_9STRA|nr:Myb-like DNA-binding protein [Nitzschia inconspicua]
MNAASSNRYYSQEDDDDSSIEFNKTTGRKGSSVPPTAGTNTGRWSNDEHQRFLSGLEQFGTGNWKKITEMVGTRSCTQVRTHAQKFFLAQQKPLLPEGTAATPASEPKKPKGSCKKSRTLEEHSATDTGDKKRRKKNSKYAQGLADASARESWMYSGGNMANGAAKRGLSGMSLLAQAAMVDPEFERMDETAEEYEKRLGKPSDDGSSSDEEDSDDDDDDNNEAGAEEISVASGNEKTQTSTKPSARQETFTPSSTTASTMDSKKEMLALREQLKIANQALQQMRQEVQLAEARAIEAIEGRNIAINECRELQEMNNQLKAEHRRMVMCLEKPNQFGTVAPTKVGSSGNRNGKSNPTPQPALSTSTLEQQMQSFFPSMAVAAQSQQLQHQDQIVIEVLQSRLKEAELRYHQVTESLARQTGVLTDQHRAVLELNSKLENERARRQALEAELERLKRQGAK